MKIHDFKQKKIHHEKIIMLTCYDYPSACTIAESTIDAVLVGDSVAMAVHGYDSTIMATIEMMILHTKAVARGLGKQFLISDLPFLSYRINLGKTVTKVRQLIQAGAQAIKIEGSDPDICETISYLVTAGIPIIGHIGLTPQSIHQLGGNRTQGKDAASAASLINAAKKLETAGCFALVIECVPETLAQTITSSISIPTIGIGAGCHTDGQILVWHDILGLQTKFQPKFLKHYAQGNETFLKAINTYAQEVRETIFPTIEHVY